MGVVGQWLGTKTYQSYSNARVGRVVGSIGLGAAAPTGHGRKKERIQGHATLPRALSCCPCWRRSRRLVICLPPVPCPHAGSAMQRSAAALVGSPGPCVRYQRSAALCCCCCCRSPGPGPASQRPAVCGACLESIGSIWKAPCPSGKHWIQTRRLLVAPTVVAVAPQRQLLPGCCGHRRRLLQLERHPLGDAARAKGLRHRCPKPPAASRWGQRPPLPLP